MRSFSFLKYFRSSAMQNFWDCKKKLGQYRSVASTTSVGIGYKTTSKERSFGNVCRMILRCRSYAPLTWFYIQFLQTLSKLRSYIDPVFYNLKIFFRRKNCLYMGKNCLLSNKYLYASLYYQYWKNIIFF